MTPLTPEELKRMRDDLESFRVKDPCGFSRTLLAEVERIQQREAELARILERIVIMQGHCRHDHHGHCQAHSLGNPCEIAEAKKLLKPPTTKRCEACDGTGDMHRIDGEWIGECPFCKQTAKQTGTEMAAETREAMNEATREHREALTDRAMELIANRTDGL